MKFLQKGMKLTVCMSPSLANACLGKSFLNFHACFDVQLATKNSARYGSLVNFCQCKEPRVGPNRLTEGLSEGSVDGGPYFTTKINLGTILVWFLVFHFCVPECSWNGSGLCLYLWVQQNSSSLDGTPKTRLFVLLNSWDNFLVTLLFISSETWVMKSSLLLETDVFL